LRRIILILASAAAAGLTACSSNAAAPFALAAPASHKAAGPTSHKGTVRVPASCRLQYSAWAHGHGKGLVTTVTAVSSAAAAADPHALEAALKKARPAVALAARHPMPGCADPRGYWNVLLMHVNAAAAKGSSASSRQAAMKDVSHIAHQLTTELKQTVQ
jgi:hypothetical protein